jgi:DNA polymerase-3 subunit beta
MTDTITISIPAGFIDAAMCAVSKEETRYYLKGVFIDARGFIAATNGLMAFAAHCADAYKLADVKPTYPSDALSGVIVPSDAILQAGKAAGRSKGLCYVIERDAQGLWWILYGNARIHFAPVDGSFPDWARIIPVAPDALVAAHFNPLYIGKLGDMAKALRDGKKDAASLFKLHQNGENPALVTFASEDGQGQRTDCCGVLVPMRETRESAFDRDAFIAA